MRLLQRCGVEVVAIGGCCGALVHHLGKERRANALAAALVERLHVEMDGQGLDAIVANASGCGTHVKDYGYLFRDDAQLAAKAAAVSAKARDVTELLAELGLPPVGNGRRQSDRRIPLRLLDAARPESRAAAADVARGGRLRPRRRSRKGISAAALQVPTTSFSPSSRSVCAIASSVISRARARPSSPPATSAASRSSRPPPAFRSCTPSSCSTGRRADRNRPHSRTSLRGRRRMRDFRTEVRDVIDPKQLLEQMLGSNVAGNARVCRWADQQTDSMR